MSDQGGESLLDRMRRRMEEQGMRVPDTLLAKTSPPPDPTPEFDSDLIPDLGPGPSQESLELDAWLNRIDILDAYRRWCGKMEPNVGSKRESVMVSCPRPGHADAHPSAWINLDKQVWVCGTCGFEGGDKFDIAAFKFGYDVPGYKQAGVFPKLKKEMIEDFFGVVVGKDITGKQQIAAPVYVPEESEPESADATPATPLTPQIPATPAEPEPEPQPLAKVTPLFDKMPEPDPEKELGYDPFQIDWRQLAPAETFLHAWMSAVTIDDIPEEFYLWMGLQALGMACGRDVVLSDNPTVKGNLFLCLYADTSSGKSRAVNNFSTLVREALPYDHTDMTSRGSRLVSLPGSPENLLDQFAKADLKDDPSTGKPLLKPVPVRALVSINELALLVSRSARQGSDFRPVMQDLFDCYDQIEFTHSSRTRGVTYAERPFCSAITTTQTYSVKELMTKYDAISGFMNRWVYVRGHEKSPQIIAPRPDLGVAVEKLKEIFDWTRTRRELSFEDDALELWRDAFFNYIHPLKRREGTMGLMARVDLILKKVILLLCVNEKLDTIPKHIVERALLLLEYLMHSYEFMGASLNRTSFETHREFVIDRLRKWMEKHGIDAFIPEGKLFHHLPKDVDRLLLVKVIRNMAELGDIETSVIKSKNGRETKVYKLAL